MSAGSQKALHTLIHGAEVLLPLHCRCSTLTCWRTWCCTSFKVRPNALPYSVMLRLLIATGHDEVGMLSLQVAAEAVQLGCSAICGSICGFPSHRMRTGGSA